MNELKIIVAGGTASGKTTISHIIESYLKSLGFNANIVDPVGCSIEEFKELAAGSIKKKTKILIEERQTYKTIGEPIRNLDIDPYCEEDWGFETVEKISNKF